MSNYTEKLTELRTSLAYVEDCLTDIHERAGDDPLTAEARTEWDEGTEYVTATRATIADLETRAKIAGEIAAGKGARNAPTVVRTPDTPTDVLADRNAGPAEYRDAVLRNLEANDVDDTNVRKMFKRHGEDTRWARDLVARSTDTYASAFSKILVGRQLALTNEERAALSGSTAAEGAVMVPTHLDPTIILTNDGTANTVRPIARVVTLTEGDTWYGVSSAGVTASFDARQAEVSDDTPADFAAPSVPVHKAQAFVQAEVEALQDIAGLPGEVLMMFADARDRLEGAAHCTGTGTNQPTGIFTALDANTNVEITSTTAATIGLIDLQSVRASTPVRFRGRGSWLMNPTWADEIRRLGTAVSASYSVDITQSNTDLLLGRPVYESDDAPETLTTTVKDNRIVFGDFSNYVIADKPGSMSIQFVPVMFNTSNNLPTGRVGWYTYWRTGADSVNDLGFRLLQDKTSA